MKSVISLKFRPRRAATYPVHRGRPPYFLSICHNSVLKSVSNRKEAPMTNRLHRLLLPTLFSATLVFAYAQPPAGTPADIQGALMNLADQPASHTSFSFDRTELQVA